MPNWAFLLNLFGKEFNVCTDPLFAEIQHYINHLCFSRLMHSFIQRLGS